MLIHPAGLLQCHYLCMSLPRHHGQDLAAMIQNGRYSASAYFVQTARCFVKAALGFVKTWRVSSKRRWVSLKRGEFRQNDAGFRRNVACFVKT